MRYSIFERFGGATNKDVLLLETIFGQNYRKLPLWIKVKQSEKNVKIQDRDRTNGNLECAFFHAISQCHAHHTVELGDKELFGHPKIGR